MRRTVYLPDDLAAQVDQYLQKHQELTFSRLVQDLLKQRTTPRDLGRLLELPALVPEATRPARLQPEDRAGHDAR
jgi:hypothetical protein